MNDPKYRIWHRQGNYWVPENEPVCILRGKDSRALEILKQYRPLDEQHAQSIAERVRAFTTYQEENPDRVDKPCTS